LAKLEAQLVDSRRRQGLKLLNALLSKVMTKSVGGAFHVWKRNVTVLALRDEMQGDRSLERELRDRDRQLVAARQELMAARARISELEAQLVEHQSKYEQLLASQRTAYKARMDIGSLDKEAAEVVEMERYLTIGANVKSAMTRRRGYYPSADDAKAVSNYRRAVEYHKQCLEAARSVSPSRNTNPLVRSAVARAVSPSKTSAAQIEEALATRATMRSPGAGTSATPVLASPPRPGPPTRATVPPPRPPPGISSSSSTPRPPAPPAARNW
jgi:hypothetical protein